MAPELVTKRSLLGFSMTSSPLKRNESNTSSMGSLTFSTSNSSLPPAVIVKSPTGNSGPSGSGLILGDELGPSLGKSMGFAVVDLDDELARKLRDAVHKEATNLSDSGSPNAVTEFLKTLCATYGVKPDKNTSESKHYVLNREGFIKAVSDILKHLAPSDAGAIFDKLAKEAGATGAVNYKTILRFISLDEADIRRLAKSLRQKIQERGASEKAYRKLFSKLAIGKHLDRAKLHELLHENFRVSLNERDVAALFKYMDVDGDGEVSAEDFILFLKHSGDQFEGERGAQRAMTIVDVAVSLNAEQEAALAQLGYQMSEGNLNANSFGTARIYLWYRRMSAVPPGQPVAPLVNIALHRDKACNALIAAGYVRISHNINKGLTSRTPLYIWAKRAMTEAEADRDAILDVAVTSGRPAVREDHIWLPPSKDFIRVDGNLNERFFGRGVFLWFRSHTRRPLEVQKASAIKLVEHLTTAEKRAMVEMHVKHYLRNHPPLWTLRETLCPRADFAALFNKHDRSGRFNVMGPERFNELLREVGLCVERDQLLALVHRIDRSSDSQVSLDEYLTFLALTDDDMDQLEETIRQTFRLTKAELAYSNSRRFRIIKKRFHEFNAENNGILSRGDIFALCRAAGILLTEPEVLNMQKRLDRDGNGQVDIWDFLRFLDAPDETKSRREKRVSEACEKLRHMTLDRQNERRKLQAAGHVDSETMWISLRDMRKAVGALPFQGVLNAEDFSRAVSRMGLVLSSTEGHMLCMRVSPGARNEVDPAAFHAFVCRSPRFLTEVVNLMESDLLKDLMDVYRYSGRKHREKLMTTVRLRAAGEGEGGGELPDGGNALYEEALDEMVAELQPDTRGQLSPPLLRKALFAAIEAAESDALLEEEVVALAQYVGADDIRTYAINVRKFLEGVVVFAEALANGGPTAAKTGGDYSVMVDAEDEEALVDVCIDVQRFIRDKARLLDGSFNYHKAFDLFDEDGSGAITLIELKHMLERFNILPRLEERTVLKLMERFDTTGEGLVSATEFKAFCETVFISTPWNPEEEKGRGAKDGKKDGEGGAAKRVELEMFVGKVTGDKVTDTLVVDVLKAMAKGDKPLTRVNFQELQRAFLSCDPDLAGVITRQEFFKALEKAKVGLSMDVYNASRALEFFMEDEDLVDYEAIIHALSRLRHLANSKMHPKKPARDEVVKDLAFTGHAKLDAKLGTMRFDLQKTMDEKEMRRGGRGEGGGGADKAGGGTRVDPYRVFWRLDDDHDGKLTLSEFKKGLDKLKLRSGALSEKEVRTLFRRLDVDKSHKVDYREFIEFMLAGEESKLMQAKRDKDKGGKDSKPQDDPFYFESSDEEEEDENGGVEETSVPGSSSEAAEGHREELYRRVFQALLDYEANDAKRRAFPALLRKFDRTGSGLVSDRRFRAFIYKCQIDLALSKREVKWLIRDLDPDMTGDVDYARFFERLQRFEKEREEKKEGGKDKKDKKDGEKRPASIDTVAPLLKRIFDGINMSAVKGRPYHSLFALSDEMQTGVVTREAFEHTLSILGCPLSKEDVGTVLEVLSPRKDKLVDYEELYHLILRTPGVGLLVTTQGPPGGGGGFGGGGDTMAFGGPGGDMGMGRTGGFMRRTSVNPVRNSLNGNNGNNMRTLRFGVGPSMMSTTSGANAMMMGTQFMRTGALGGGGGAGSSNNNNQLNFMQTGAFNGIGMDNSGFNGMGGAPLSRSMRDDWGIDVIDPLLESIGLRVRNCVRERVQQWGPQFSLTRQFEMQDPERKGYLGKKDFQRVLQHLGAPLSALELAQVVQKFDRYGDSMVDYEEFCRVVMVDAREFDSIVRRLAARLAELKKKGTNVATAFEMFDIDGAGFIAARDFREACKQLQLPSTEVQLQTLMEHFGSVGDPNLICYDDFLTYVAGVNTSAAGMTARPGMGLTGALDRGGSFNGRMDESFAGSRGNSFESGPYPEITRRLDFAMTKSDLSASRAAEDPWRRTSSLSPQRTMQGNADAQNYGGSMLFERPVLASGVGSPYHTPARSKAGMTGFAAEGAATAGRRRALQWMCPVCFFAENESRSQVCEMCSSANPSRSDQQILQQCYNCAYQNGDYSVECEMCGEPLANRAARNVRSNSKNVISSPGKTGWRAPVAGSDSDDSDREVAPKNRKGRR